MKANSKTVLEVLHQVDTSRFPPYMRLRGLKPSAVRFAFTEKLIADFRGHGVLLTEIGRSVLATSRCTA